MAEALLLVGVQLLELKLQAAKADCTTGSGSTPMPSDPHEAPSDAEDPSAPLSLITQLAAAAFPCPHRGVSAAAFQFLSGKCQCVCRCQGGVGRGGTFNMEGCSAFVR